MRAEYSTSHILFMKCDADILDIENSESKNMNGRYKLEWKPHNNAILELEASTTLNKSRAFTLDVLCGF